MRRTPMASRMPTTIRTNTATIMLGRLAAGLGLDDHAADAVLGADEFADDHADQRERDGGVSEANSQAMVEGTITVRVTCHSPAPSRRAALMWSRSTARAPSKVLKNTRNNTTSQAVTILEASPMPNARMMIGDSAMRGIELKAVM